MINMSKAVGSESSSDHDVCMVFPVSKSTKKFTTKGLEIISKIIKELKQENVHMYYSTQKDEIYVLIRADDDRLAEFADRYNMFFLANSETLKVRANEGLPGDSTRSAVRPMNLDKDGELIRSLGISNFDTYDYIYLQYDRLETLQDLYVNDEFTKTPFSERHRIGIIRRILDDPEEVGGLEIRTNRLLITVDKETDGKQPVLKAVFPLHNKDELRKLEEIWSKGLSCFQSNQPIGNIRDYFGEKIALYYGFMKHFYVSLFYVSVVGLGTQIVIAAFVNVNYPIVAFYSIFIVLFGVYFTETWKRKEKYIALKHGMIDFESKESYRSEFEEDKILSMAGRREMYYSPAKRGFKMAISFTILALLCACVIGSTACVYIFRAWFSGLNAESSQAASIIASVLNAVQMQIYGFIYSKLSNWLTDFENHSTDTEYEDSMIAKNFAFSFINSYASFFYIAFFASSVRRNDYPGMPADAPQKQWTGQCGAPTCMQTLAINLGIVLATAMIVGNVTELVIPYILFLQKKKAESKGVDANAIVTAAENEFYMASYDGKNVISDYLEIAILFGYMTMFVSALPGAAFIVLIALWVEVKGDSWKVCNLTRRPWPASAEDIGTWQSVYELVTTASVITNAAMIVFTMQLVEDYTEFTQFWIFIGFQWVMFTLQYVIGLLISDTPTEVTVQKNRSDYFNRKLILREIDDDAEDDDTMKADVKSDKDGIQTFINGLLAISDTETRMTGAEWGRIHHSPTITGQGTW